MLTIITPAMSGDLVTVDRVKNELSITDPAADSRLEDLIAEASALLAAYCGRDTFGAEDLVQIERLSCARRSITLLRDLAVGITSVEVNGATLDDDAYEVDEPLLYRLENDQRGWWSGKVVITFSAGFNLPQDAPMALSRAALDLVVGMYRGTGRDVAVRSEQVEGVGQTSYFDTKSGPIALSADRIAALSRYRTGFVR